MPPDSAQERTRLAWRRTTLAETVVVILLVRLALLHDNRTIALAVSALGGLCWVAFLVLVQRRIAAIGRPARPPRSLLIPISGLCLLLGALGFVLVLTR